MDIKTISLKNYIFYCYLIAGAIWYAFTNNLIHNQTILEFVNFIKLLIGENFEFTMISFVIGLPFELFFARIIYLVRCGDKFLVCFLFRKRIVDSK